MPTALDFRPLSTGLAWFAALLAPAAEPARTSATPAAQAGATQSVTNDPTTASFEVLGARGARALGGSRVSKNTRAGAARDSRSRSQDGLGELGAALSKEGIVLHREAGVLSIPVQVQVKSELLEYLLVGPNGAAHESLFLTRVRPSVLNTALLLLGVEPGRNAHFEDRAGADEEGRPNKQIYPPEGDGFFLYVAWRERDEVYFFRLEDLVRNLENGRSLTRHRWVYLGSRFAALKAGAPETFVADVEGNLINLAYFFQGNTLLTAVPEECFAQTIWAANEWLLPGQGEGLRLYFARRPLAQLEPAWLAELPSVGAAPADGTPKEAK